MASVLKKGGKYDDDFVWFKKRKRLKTVGHNRIPSGDRGGAILKPNLKTGAVILHSIKNHAKG